TAVSAASSTVGEKRGHAEANLGNGESERVEKQARQEAGAPVTTGVSINTTPSYTTTMTTTTTATSASTATLFAAPSRVTVKQEVIEDAPVQVKTEPGYGAGFSQ
ncbi:MAG: hypothetical protein KDH94_06260, partial [Coxiellaceae bacterium]|nr:hypothetical protein [Coxiellaceae bacterium]